jgi:hypothetical protein
VEPCAKASLKYIGERDTTNCEEDICHYCALHGLSLSTDVLFVSTRWNIIESIEEYTYKPEEKIKIDEYIELSTISAV